MLKYSQDKKRSALTFLSVTNTMFPYIDTAISEKRVVNYADEFPRYTLEDVGLDLDNELIIFYFNGNVEKVIDLKIYYISQPRSIPFEFYVANRNDSSDYFVINFGY